MTNTSRFVTGIATLAVLAMAARQPAYGQDIQYRGDPDARKRMTLLLRDWEPKPMVHLPAHDVPRAKFYVIDVHNHVNDAGGVHGQEIPAAEVVKGMDRANTDHGSLVFVLERFFGGSGPMHAGSAAIGRLGTELR